MRLPEFGVKYPVTNIMIFFAILVLGLFSLTKLPIDLMPEIEPAAVSVITVYEGAGAEDVENKVTEILENQLSTISNLDKVTSRSREGLSVVTCTFKWGTNLDEASNDVRDKLELAKRSLPDEIDTPIVFKFNTTMIPIMFLGVNCSDNTYPQIYRIVDKQVGDALKRIPGVGSVNMYGGLERQINVEIDRGRLESYGLSVQKVISRLAEENITLPAGSLKSGYIDYDLRVPGEFSRPEQIKNIILTQDMGRVVYLKDVAKVSDSFKEVTMLVRNNAGKAMMLMIQKRSGANTVEVAKNVKKELERIKKNIPPDITFSLMTDNSEHIVRAIKDLTGSVYWGGFWVILVVFFFLRQIKPSLIIALTIPFSLIIAFIFIYAFGYTINIMSLSSLAIAIGMVVDNAIVVTDNAYRHRERGQRPGEAAVQGANEVGMAIAASTLTTVVVFLPMAFLTGIVGIIFKQLALIVCVTLIASLFTALTFTPMLCSKMMTVMPKGKFFETSGKFLDKIDAIYAKMLAWALKFKKTVIFIAVGIFALSIMALRLVGSEFIPEEDTGDLNMTMEMPVGTRVEETDKIARLAEVIAQKEVPEATNVFARVGQASSARFGAAFGAKLGSHVAEIGLKLVPLGERKRGVKEIAQNLRTKLKDLTGVKKITIRAGNPFSRMLFGGNKPVSIEIMGYDLDATDNLAYQIRDELRKISGITDIAISREIGKPELQVDVDREKASSMGLSMSYITDTMRTYFYGTTASKYREGGEEYDIFVRLNENDRVSIKDVGEIPLSTPSGKIVKLSNVAKVVHRTGPIEIARKNQDRIVSVDADTYKRSLGEVAKDVKAMLAKLNLPYGVTINLGSDVEEQAKSFKDLIMLVLLGCVLVYMVMAAQFESLKDPFIIMFSVPFAFSGVVFALLVTKTTLSIISFLGLVMLVGIVVNNAIVLIDYINILRARGMSLVEAITVGGKNRLRPVLMTTITTIAGLLPLALSRGEGSETWQPLGTSMLGGLTFSTLITLIFIPVLYALLNRDKARQK